MNFCSLWSKKQNDVFNKSKELLQSSLVLIHYNPGYPLVLSCDASPYGIGSVLEMHVFHISSISHKMPDGTERPVAFASRTLAPAEKKYA